MDINNPAPAERKAVASLAGIFAARMLGLFMILPVFSLYAKHLQGVTPTLIGLALGIYGLTQALLQIPFGTLSDRFGRKPIITFGLILFAIGSVVAAMSTSIYGIILGRALQGAGAVGSTIIALVADVTREETRTKSMAIIGLTIGTSFSIGMVLGPILNSYIHVSGIFWLTAVLAIAGIVLLHTKVPNPVNFARHRDAQTVPSQIKDIITNKELLRLDLGIMLQHATLTAMFVVMPIVLTKHAHLAEVHQWYIYLPVLVLSFIGMVPLIIIAEKKRKMKPIFLGAIVATIVANLIMFFGYTSVPLLTLGLFIFFTAFNLLEASLPSLISKIAPSGSKGTAMGIYSSSQFLGIFIGGSLGGFLFGHHQVSVVFLLCAVFGLVWLLAAGSMEKPPHLATFMLHVGDVDSSQAEQLRQELLTHVGVADVFIGAEEGVAYLKIDNQTVDKDKLLTYSTNA